MLYQLIFGIKYMENILNNIDKSYENNLTEGEYKGLVSFYTLGCKVNQYETQCLIEHFREAGYRVTEDNVPADIYVVNTCSVTNLADRKSRQHIRQFNKKNPDAVIVVVGCYAQLKPDEVAKLPGVCVVAGTNEKNNIVDYVESYLKEQGKKSIEKHILSYDNIDEYEDLGFISNMESRNRAFIKVQEGCDRFCTYCIIPYARGKARSRSEESIVQEVSKLVEKGYREIVLTGINTALYGVDLPANNGKSGIANLIEHISGIEGDFRIRLSSLEPNVIDVELAKKLAKYDKLCPHMHLSIQSGSDAVLKRMGRRYNVETYCKIVEALREADPCYAITTDIISGFPGENEEEFQDTLRTVEDIGFFKIHTFKYSGRKGTPAYDMPNQVADVVKSSRSAKIAELARVSSKNFMDKNLGMVRRVLFEAYDEKSGMIYGYTDNYIRVKCYAPYEKDYLGEFAQVKLISIDEDKIIGEIV